MQGAGSGDDAVELLLRAARRKALARALAAGVPVVFLACGPPRGFVPAAMPSKPGEILPPPPSAAPPGVAVDQQVHCEEGAALPVSAVHLKPAVSVDYLALRSAGGVPNEGDPNSWTSTQFDVLSQTGIACGTAPVGSPCKELIARHPAAPVNAQCGQICRELSVVTTRHGEVGRWATPEQLNVLLAPIDTVDEALLLAQAHHYNISCEPESTRARRTETGYEIYATRMTSMCSPIVIMGYWLRVSATGEVSELSSSEVSRSDACVGRRPDGLLNAAAPFVARTPEGALRPAPDACSAFLAQSAYLEAASVLAFERLAAELRRLGAPEELVQAALRARVDEVRHAEVVAGLAMARGARVETPVTEPQGLRSLEAIALENAVEGCVRETYGALVGALQALTAEDEPVRSAMDPIAEDELRHATLSHRVHQWLLERLDDSGRARIKQAMASAIRELREGREGLPPQALAALGLPSGPQRTALLDQLQEEVWNPLLS